MTIESYTKKYKTRSTLGNPCDTDEDCSERGLHNDGSFLPNAD